MDFGELKELIRILEESNLSELEVEQDGRRIRLQKPFPGVNPLPAASHLALQTQEAGAASSPAPKGAPEENPAEADSEVELEPGLDTINSPMVGTFYRAPSPDEDPFVREGDRVEPEQTVCIVEAMKLMNEVVAKFAGVIEQILVENGEPVEFGQPLFAIRPAE